MAYSESPIPDSEKLNRLQLETVCVCVCVCVCCVRGV